MRIDVYFQATRERHQLCKDCYAGLSRTLQPILQQKNYSNRNLASKKVDPFWPARVSLGNYITKSVNAYFDIWFLDDCKIGDSPVKIIENVPTVVQHTRLTGLKMNSSKC